MRRLVILLGAIAITMLAVGSAGADYWETSRYKLDGSQSIVNIYDPKSPPPNPPFAVYPHALVGTMTVDWGAATMRAPRARSPLMTLLEALERIVFIRPFLRWGGAPVRAGAVHSYRSTLYDARRWAVGCPSWGAAPGTGEEAP